MHKLPPCWNSQTSFPQTPHSKCTIRMTKMKHPIEHELWKDFSNNSLSRDRTDDPNGQHPHTKNPPLKQVHPSSNDSPFSYAFDGRTSSCTAWVGTVLNPRGCAPGAKNAILQGTNWNRGMTLHLRRWPSGVDPDLDAMAALPWVACLQKTRWAIKFMMRFATCSRESLRLPTLGWKPDLCLVEICPTIKIPPPHCRQNKLCNQNPNTKAHKHPAARSAGSNLGRLVHVNTHQKKRTG